MVFLEPTQLAAAIAVALVRSGVLRYHERPLACSGRTSTPLICYSLVIFRVEHV
jgi:hypothetical protein